MKKRTCEQFERIANEIHSHKYLYHQDYAGSTHKIRITCPIHGDFMQQASSHIHGHGCPKCKYETKSKGKVKKEEFVRRALAIHGDKYDYSKTVIDGMINKVWITCPIHGPFFQQAISHLSGCGCPKCFGKNKSTKEFIDKAKSIHGDAYDYSETEYRSAKEKVKIICRKHGAFYQIAGNHLNGSGCPKCKTKRIGRKITEEYAYSIAEQCVYIKEFRKKDATVYAKAKKNGWIKSYTWLKPSVPESNYSREDKVHCVYAYIDEKNMFVYVGRTNNIKTRDGSHRRSYHKDSVFKHFEEYGIDIPVPIILENNLTAIESQRAEEKYLNYYITRNYKPINKAKVGEGVSSLGYIDSKWTFERTKEEASRYSSRYEFCKKSPKAYEKARRTGWIRTFFPNEVIKTSRTYEECYNKAKEYVTLKEFRLNERKIYNYAVEHKWVMDYDWLERKG